MAISVVSFSFSRAAQPEAQGPSSLLDDGFLYCILSPTGLQNSIGGPEGPFGRVWLSPPHLVSDASEPQLIRPPRAPSTGLSLPHLISNFSGPQLIRGPKGPLRRLSLPHLISNFSGPPTQSGALSPFGLGWLFLPLSFNSVWSLTVWLPVLTELYNISTPTQSLEWHVWSSSVYECIMAFYLVPFHQPNPPTQSLSITGHWNVSLPSGVSPWNGMFARAEGQNITESVHFFFSFQ